MDHLGSLVFSPVESRAYDHWSKLIHTCDDTKCLWHDGSSCRPVDPKVWITLNGVGTPFIRRWSKWSMFLEQNPKIFRAAARVRAGWSLHVSFDFFFLWIITYYYYYLASRRHSVMIQPHGSRWINLDHKTYFSTRFYDPNVTDNICPFNHGSSWITGFFPCWVKGLWPMIQLDPCLQGHMLSYHTAALGIMIQLS